MNKTETGGPAFKLPPGTANMSDPSQSGGMTLRDYFAAKAMHGLIAQSQGTAYSSHVAVGAEYAYRMADAMLRARDEK